MIERALTGMPKRWVPKIMRKAGSLNQIRVDEKVIRKRITFSLQPMTNRAANLSDFEGMRQAGAVEVILATPEDLGLVLKATKGGRMQHPIAINLKRCSKITLDAIA